MGAIYRKQQETDVLSVEENFFIMIPGKDIMEVRSEHVKNVIVSTWI